MNYCVLLVVFKELDLFYFILFFSQTSKALHRERQTALILRFKLLRLVLLALFLLVHASVFLVINWKAFLACMFLARKVLSLESSFSVL